VAIKGYSRDDFGVHLNEVVSPSHPIRSIELLKGRINELETIDRALYAAGRHIFIFGDRGVGKSSLAATAAYQYQSSDADPLFVSGAPDDTFVSIIANIAYQAIGQSRTHAVKTTRQHGFEFKGLKLGRSEEISTVDLAAHIRTVGDAAELIKQVAAFHSEKPIIVMDEFDTIVSPDERNKFAALLKQMGDQSVNLKFIFTGIGRTLDELLGAHQSAHRQLDTVEVQRLPWEARRDIVQSAAAEFDITVDNDVNWRMAAISDGFPYYLHLITEKMLWEAFAERDFVANIGWEQFHRGLKAAIASINAELRKPYEMAVNLRTPEYEDLVWSTADDEDLIRSANSMYESYTVLLRKRKERPHLDRKKYGELLRRLKATSYGEVLLPIEKRPGLYTYRNRMLRGYVRMQAAADGIELSGEREAPRQVMHIGSSRTGTFGSRVPAGVKLGRLDRDN
jgi:hypothetical protein